MEGGSYISCTLPAGLIFSRLSFSASSRLTLTNQHRCRRVRQSGYPRGLRGKPLYFRNFGKLEALVVDAIIRRLVTTELAAMPDEERGAIMYSSPRPGPNSTSGKMISCKK